MTAKPLLTGAALTLALAGLICLFAPAELLAAAARGSGIAAIPLVQLWGAALLGLGMLDWIARSALVGGIFGRPLIAGNLVHFGCGSLVLIKGGLAAPSVLEWSGFAVYVLFAVSFAVTLFLPRAKPENSN